MDELFTPLVPEEPFPITGEAPRRLCPDCKVELVTAMKDFGISSTNAFIVPDIFTLDICVCPQCGLTRFYSSKHRQQREQAARDAQPPQHTVTIGKEVAPRPTGPADPWEEKKSGLFGLFGDKD